MARAFRREGVWIAKVKDPSGAWVQIRLPEVRTKKRAEEMAADLALRYRRQREGLEPLAHDSSLTLRELLSWWLDTYSKKLASHYGNQNRYETHFADSELVQLPLRALTSAKIESYLQAKSGTLSAASLNQLRGMIRTAWNCGRRAGFCAGPTRWPTSSLAGSRSASRPSSRPTRWRPCSTRSPSAGGPSSPPPSTPGCARAN